MCNFSENDMLSLIFLYGYLTSTSAIQFSHPFRNAEVHNRLPKTLTPTRYDLELTPNFDDGTFAGTVKIYVNTLEDTTNVTVHKRNLNVSKDSISIIYDNSGKYDSKEFSLVEEEAQEFLVMIFLPGLRKGSKYIVTIVNFVGKLNNEKRGFYLGYLKNKDGELRKFAATQFEPTNARETFPCFDEPEYKATLNLKINRPSQTYMTIANGIRNSTSSSGLSDVFDTTKPMPTYLYAFVVSEMRLSDPFAKVRVLAKPQDLLADNHMFALTRSQILLDKMKEYVNISCGAEKIEHAAIPNEYLLEGAVGNWGLITYKESRLLTSEETDASNKQLIVTTIAQKTADQWFGNLVTPGWWEFIWLSAGFATFFGNYAGNWAEPNMDLTEQFVVKTTHSALYFDSLDTTRPMNKNADTPDEILSLFDEVAYGKAASVIRMIQGFLTESVFKKSINVYLDKMKSQSCTPSDLYKSIQSVLDNLEVELWNPPLNISDIMSSWDSVLGYPVVNVKRLYGIKENNIQLRQERFVLKNAFGPKGTWKIPINFYSSHYSNITLPYTWLTKTEENASYPYADDDNWLIVNAKQTGFYRVNYDDRNWVLIAIALLTQHESIDVLNRAQLIDDAFNLARAGRLDYTKPIELSMYLKNEQDYIPFYPFFKSVNFLNNMLQYTTTYDLFKEYVLNVLNNIYLYLRFGNSVVEKHTDTLNRIQVLNWLCRLGHGECLTLSLSMFRKWKVGGDKIPTNLQSSVFCGAMRAGSVEDHAFLLNKLTDDRHLRSRIVNGLGCTENIETLTKYLEMSLSGNSLLPPDDVIKSVYDKSSVGLQAALDFLENNFFEIKNKCPDSIKFLVTGIGETLSTENQYKQLKRLADNSKDKDLFEHALNSAEDNIRWVKEKTSAISAALNIIKNDGKKIHANGVLIIASCLVTVKILRNKFV